jgi:hypothetical protein
MNTYWTRDSSTSTDVTFYVQQGWRYGLTTTSGLAAGFFEESSIRNRIFFDFDNFYQAPGGCDARNLCWEGLQLELIAEYIDPGGTNSDFSWRTGFASFSVATAGLANPYDLTNAFKVGLDSINRVSFLANGNGDDPYRVLAGVHLTQADVLSSPIVTGIPVMSFGLNEQNSFFLPISHTREFFVAMSTTTDETLLTNNPGCGACTMSLEGELYWEPDTEGWYAVQVKVYDAIDTEVWSVVDWMINVVDFSLISRPTTEVLSFATLDTNAEQNFGNYDIVEWSATFEISITIRADSGYSN